MITVHHLNDSRSQRILWLLEELALPYEIRRYERDRKSMAAPAELRAIHPLGKSPILQDTGGGLEDVTLVESGAICEYLCRKTAGLLGPPAAREDVLRYYQFLHYAEGSLMPCCSPCSSSVGCLFLEKPQCDV